MEVYHGKLLSLLGNLLTTMFYIVVSKSVSKRMGGKDYAIFADKAHAGPADA